MERIDCPFLGQGKPGEIPEAVCRNVGKGLEVIDDEVQRNTGFCGFVKQTTPECTVKEGVDPSTIRKYVDSYILTAEGLRLEDPYKGLKERTE